jgi:hypothetical protein
MDRGLISAPALQVVVADEIHVLRFRLFLSCGGQGESRQRPPKDQCDDPCLTHAILARHKLSFSHSAANHGWRGLDRDVSNFTMFLFAFVVADGRMIPPLEMAVE